MKSLERRIKKMETASKEKVAVVMWKKYGEPADEVIERHLAAQPEHRGKGFELVVVGWQDPDLDEGR